MKKNDQLELYKTIFNKSNDIILIFRVKRNFKPDVFIEINDIAQIRLNYSKNDFLNLTFIDIDAEAKKSDHPDLMKKIIEKKTIIFERVLVSKNNDTIPVEINAHSFYLNGENVILAIARDITQRRMSENALKYKSDFETLISLISARLINLVTESIDKVLDSSLEEISQFVEADRSYIILYNKQRDKMSLSHEWCSDYAERVRDHFQDVASDNLSYFDMLIKKKQPFLFDDVESLPKKAGAEHSYFIMQNIKSILIIPLMSHDDLVGFIGFETVRDKKHWDDNTINLLRFAGEIFINALERKKREQMLASRIKYESNLALCSRTLLVNKVKKEALNTALRYMLEITQVNRVYIFENFFDNKDGLYMKQTYEVTDGITEPEINNSILQKIPYKHGFNRWRNNLSRGYPIRGHIRDFPLPEKEILEVQKIKSILVLPILVNGEWHGFIGFDATVEERVWNDEDVRLLNTASEIIGSFMEIRRKESSLEDLISDLEKALSKAEEANRLKSEFLAMMSHELRTPLSGIIGFSELMLNDDELNNDQKENINYINLSGQRLLQIINDLLQISMIEAGKISINFSEFDIEQVIKDINILLKENIALQGNTLTYEIKKSKVFYSDPLRVRQVLFNIIGNAVKYTTDGSIHVTVDFQDGRYLIKVKDTGIGIEPEKTDEIFDMFKQADSSNTRKYGGIGLGLAVSKKLIDILNGEIFVETTPGKGSVFTVVIPKGDMMVRSEKVVKYGIENFDSTLKQGVKIFYAEDDSAYYRLLEKIFSEQPNCEFKGFTNGQELLDYFKNNSADMIILDIQLPVLDGIESLYEIRKKNIQIPVIALTAFAMLDDIERYKNEGFTDYITKPIDKNKFIMKINQYL